MVARMISLARCPLWFAACLLSAVVLSLSIVAPATADTVDTDNATTSDSNASPALIWHMTIDDPIGPAISEWFVTSLSEAADAGADACVFQMNTPGGLDSAMRDMISAILSSPVPVISYVAPTGSRAASAGTYLLYASHLAAMAPSTHLGAATPVQVGGGGPSDRTPRDPRTERDADESSESNDRTTSESMPRALDNQEAARSKAVNDAVAYIRGLADLRQRNADWAEQAVRDAATLTSRQALEKGVIDLVAKDIDDLLSQANGMTFYTADGEQTLSLDAPQIVEVERDWRIAFLAIITNPSIAYLLLLAGIYGLILEFSNPGATVPGVLGAICLLIGMYALQMFPLNYVGIALIALGIGLMIAEAFAPSFGVLGLGGLAAFVLGSVMLVDSDVPGLRVALPLIFALGVAAAAAIIMTLRMALKARKRGVVSGDGALVGRHGVVTQCDDEHVWVKVEGELWHAQAAPGVTLALGMPVRVVGRHDLVLDVVPQVSPAVTQ